MIVIGQLPLLVWLLLTIRSPSAEQASEISRSPGKASSAATEVNAAGASLTSHPSTVVFVILPVTPGAVVSLIVMV